jgi:hypothetical protein
VVAIDIDIADIHVSWQVRQVAADIFGSTPLIRVGQWPKLLLVFRAGEPIDTQHIGGVDILGRGSQFVAFGIHPGTGKAYYWLEDSPSGIDVSSVPEVSLKQIKLFVNEVYGFIGAAAPGGRGQRQFARADQSWPWPAPFPLTKARSKLESSATKMAGSLMGVKRS